MTTTTIGFEAPFPDQTETDQTEAGEALSDYARGFRNGLKAGMEAGHAGGRAYEQVDVQQHIEARLAALPAEETETARAFRNLAAQLPDPRRDRKTG